MNESQTEENGNETQEGDVTAPEEDTKSPEGDVPAEEGDSPDSDPMEVGDNNSQSTEEEKMDEKERDLFKLVVVNSYGSQDVRKLVDDPNKMLQLSGEANCL